MARVEFFSIRRPSRASKRPRGETLKTLSGSIFLRFVNPGYYDVQAQRISRRIYTEVYPIMPATSPKKAQARSAACCKRIHSVIWSLSTVSLVSLLFLRDRVLARHIVDEHTCGGDPNVDSPLLSFLICLSSTIRSYMLEEWAFWLLEVLCDRLLPGYYLYVAFYFLFYY